LGPAFVEAPAQTAPEENIRASVFGSVSMPLSIMRPVVGHVNVGSSIERLPRIIAPGAYKIVSEEWLTTACSCHRRMTVSPLNRIMPLN